MPATLSMDEAEDGERYTRLSTNTEEWAMSLQTVVRHTHKYMLSEDEIMADAFFGLVSISDS